VLNGRVLLGSCEKCDFEMYFRGTTSTRVFTCSKFGPVNYEKRKPFPANFLPTMSDATDEKLKDVAADDIEAMFANMKKKSKKSKKKKKKSKKSKEDKDDEAGSDEDTSKDTEETVTEIYTYDQMLDRVFEKLQSNNPELMHKKRYKLKPPQIMRIGTRKCMWHNYPDICETLKRKPDHVMQFYLTELGTTGNLDGNGRLVLKGTFVPKKIESLLRKYITEYVTCRLCKSPDTALVKDSNSRLFFVQCHACGARRSVSTIKTGYLATQRGERRAARNK
jgi:translation initiation factor 2 subunit 2